jgi:hypothetical protein
VVPTGHYGEERTLTWPRSELGTSARLAQTVTSKKDVEVNHPLYLSKDKNDKDQEWRMHTNT